MTREQTKELLYVIQGAYPSKEIGDISNTINSWYLILGDYEADLVLQATTAYMKANPNKHFFPSAPDIEDEIQKMTTPEPMSENEAIDKIMKAIERSSWHSQEEFEKLDPILQKIVGSPQQLQDWAILRVDEIVNSIQPRIARDYRNEVQRQQEYARLPEDVRARIDAVNNRPRLFEGRMITDESKTGTD